MSEMLLTITQALQLVALAPSIFVIAFLVCTSKRDGDNFVPIFYFLALGASFLIPLLSIFGEVDEMRVYLGWLMFAANLSPAFSFLLIVQFLHGARPPLLYWLVLTIPIFGGTPFIYASIQASEVCLDNTYCVVTDDLRMLYNVVSAALIFLLLMVYIARSLSRIAIDDIDRKHKYWLVVSLVLLNLILLLVDLFTLADNLSKSDALLISTVIRIGFIYLVLTSIFRIFYDLFDIQMPEMMGQKQPLRDTEMDKKSAEKITELLSAKKLYREMELSRDMLAKELGLSEHQVSRIINSHFHKNFNELVNQYRVDEAKERLKREDTQITVIAFDVGFNSIASFNRVFKEMAGSSPSAYREFHKIPTPTA
jgi:AraC-like DNA-binding protein